MNHEQAFLDAIRQEPDDDVHRLVFADWLEERGDPRGPFIRCQVRAEQRSLGDPERLALEEEAADLLEVHRHAWLADLTDRADHWTFRRGFVETVTLSKDAFLDLPERFFHRYPAREFHLTLEPLDRSPHDLTDLASCPNLRFAERLGLVHRFLADGAVESLLLSPHLMRLRGLTLSGTYLTARWLGNVERYPVLAGIEELDLSNCPFLHDRVLRALSASRQIGTLKRLHLGGTALTPYGLLTLLTPHKLCRLSELEVSMMSVPALADASQRALYELASSPALEQLTSLSLCGGSLAGERASRLFDAPLRGLRHLRITGCPMNGSAIQALSQAPYLRELTHLGLSRNGIDCDDLVALANSPILERVEQLDLSDNSIEGPGLTALANSTTLTRLARLDLSRNRIGGPSIVALVHGSLASNLRWLALSETFVGRKGTEGLASSRTLTRLTSLDLSLNRLGSDCAEILARSANFGHLVALGLASNQLGDRGVQALAAAPGMPRLRRLDLRYNGIGRAGVEALLRSTTLPELHVLDLRGNELINDDKPRLTARFGGMVHI